MESIGAVIVGILCIILGISNIRGNITTLHSYHTKRVSEEDRLPFGKKIGLGTIIVGIGLAAFGGLSYASEKLGQEIFFIAANVCLIVCLIIGLGIAFYAMKKYNKGIF